MFDKEQITEGEIERLSSLARLARGDILKMTTLAGSGHPGGSMSSLDIYLVLFSYAVLDRPERDRIVISHGHTSPGVYVALGRLAFLPIDEVIAFFRKAGSPFEGHVVRGIPFIDWSTGNLGQGLSAGCGLAIASKIRHEDPHVYVVMGDGEQQKGQIAEARRFAKKYGLSNITVIIDYNRLQISGNIKDVMPQNIVENYLSDGWEVIEIDGHNYNEIYQAIRRARQSEEPCCILAHTIMGKGVQFMENKEKYHGSPLNEKEYKEAMAILGLDDDLERYRGQRAGMWSYTPVILDEFPTQIDPGIPFDYKDEDRIDNRTAFGRTLKAIADTNIKKGIPVCALDCDLSSSVKTDAFAKAYPEYFFQGGIQEHNTATIAGAISLRGILTFFGDFGVFGIDETFNQQRLNDMNMTNLKLILTHVGLDVGQDGKTHQCIDYIGLSRGLFGFKTIVPADPNQVDRVIRYIVCRKGNFLVAMGRNRWPVIKRSDGSSFFGNGYNFEYGRMDIIEEGNEIAIITYGGMLSRAITIRERLLKKGISVAVVNMPCVNEVDKKVMDRYLSMPIIVTYEDHNVYTGIAPLVGDYLLRRGYQGRFDAFGVKNYGASGETDELYMIEGLDVDSMEMAILKMTGRE